MKKLSFSLLVMLGFFATVFMACDEDDEPDVEVADPSVTAPGDATVTASEDEVLSFTINIPGEYASASVAVDPATLGTASVTSEPATDATSGTVEVTFTAGGDAGTGTVTLTVTDDLNQTGSAAANVTVEEEGNESPGMAFVGDTIPDFEDLSTLAAALEATDLDEVLNGEGPFTVFAPNNAAFTALLEALELDDLPAVIAELGEDGVSQLLQAHVVVDSLPSDIIEAQDYTTVNDSTITITIEGENVFANGARVVTPNIMAGNGVIHVIDSVINLPEVGVSDPEMVVVTDADLTTETYNWTADNVYMVDGLVFLEEGGVLNIEAGTTVRFIADPSSEEDNTSSLIIARGAQINAAGSADAPIIFTAEADTAGAVLDPIADNAAWGGLVILGRASVEEEGATEVQIEGIDSGEPRGQYGGTDDADNSGTLSYVSIRYTGVGLSAGNEIQGLTLGGVGSGTTIEFIDIFSSSDDGVEIFGGTVNIRYISVAFVTDDAFDFDLGWRGSGQFLFGIQASGDDQYDHIGEWDGADDDDGFFSAPNLANATFVGPGVGATGPARAILMRDAFAGKLLNSILEDYPLAAIQVEDRQDGVDSYERLQNPSDEEDDEDDGFQLEIKGNTFANFGGYVEAEGLASLVEATAGEDDGFTGETAATETELVDNNEYSATSVLTGVSRTTDGGLNPVPAAATTAPVEVPEGLETVDYRGAFAPGEAAWISGWSTLAQKGYLAQ